MPRLAPFGGNRNISADCVYRFHKGYALSNLPKKENDLFIILNLVCLKLTGNTLPADGLPENLWTYLEFGGRRSISPKYSCETIMRPCYFSDLSFSVKRSLICDEIKCIVANTEKMPTMFKEIIDLGFVIPHTDGRQHAFGQGSQTYRKYENSYPEINRRCDNAITSFLKTKAYDCLTGEADSSDELLDIIKNSKKKETPYPDSDTRTFWWLSNNKNIGKIFQTSSYSQRRATPYDGQASDWSENTTINASKRIDCMLLSGMKAREGVGKEFTITRQEKIRKGKEGEMFEIMMKCLPYVWASASPSNQSEQVIQNNFRRRLWMKLSVRGCFGMGFAGCGMIKPDGSIDHFKLGWDKYKTASGNLSSNDLIRVLCGKKDRVDDNSIKYKMVKQFC